MNESVAFCPQCRADSLFVQTAGVRRCSVCGFQFSISERRVADTGSENSGGMGVVPVLLKVILIMLALVVVVIGIAFAGCALALSGGHF